MFSGSVLDPLNLAEDFVRHNMAETRKGEKNSDPNSLPETQAAILQTLSWEQVP